VSLDIRARGTAPAAPARAGAIFCGSIKFFTFKGKSTIELNYVFDMHTEGCSSELVLVGKDHN